MTNEQPDERLSAYLDGELDSGQRAEVEARLATDPNYRRQLDALQAARARVAALPLVRLSPQFSAEILQRLPSAAPAPALRLADACQANEGQLQQTTPTATAVELPGSGRRSWRAARLWVWPVVALAAGLLLSVFNPEPVERELARKTAEDRPTTKSSSPSAPLPPAIMKSDDGAVGKADSDASALGLERAGAQPVRDSLGRSAADTDSLDAHTGQASDQPSMGLLHGSVASDPAEQAAPLLVLDYAVEPDVLASDRFYQTLARNSIAFEGTAVQIEDAVTRGTGAFGTSALGEQAGAPSAGASSDGIGAASEPRPEVRALSADEADRRAMHDQELAVESERARGAKLAHPLTLDKRAAVAAEPESRAARGEAGPSRAEDSPLGPVVIRELAEEAALSANFRGGGSASTGRQIAGAPMRQNAAGRAEDSLQEESAPTAEESASEWILVEAPLPQVQATIRELQADSAHYQAIQYAVEGAHSEAHAVTLLDQVAGLPAAERFLAANDAWDASGAATDRGGQNGQQAVPAPADAENTAEAKLAPAEALAPRVPSTAGPSSSNVAGDAVPSQRPTGAQPSRGNSQTGRAAGDVSQRGAEPVSPLVLGRAKASAAESSADKVSSSTPPAPETVRERLADGKQVALQDQGAGHDQEAGSAATAGKPALRGRNESLADEAKDLVGLDVDAAGQHRGAYARRIVARSAVGNRSQQVAEESQAGVLPSGEQLGRSGDDAVPSKAFASRLSEAAVDQLSTALRKDKLRYAEGAHPNAVAPATSPAASHVYYYRGEDLPRLRVPQSGLAEPNMLKQRFAAPATGNRVTNAPAGQDRAASEHAAGFGGRVALPAELYRQAGAAPQVDTRASDRTDEFDSSQPPVRVLFRLYSNSQAPAVAAPARDPADGQP